MRIMMMVGFEKRLLWISLTDALINVSLSVVLALTFGIVGVALGTLIPTVLVGWILVLPLALSYLKLSPLLYAKYILSAGGPVVLFGACLGATLYFLPISAEGGFFELALRGGLSAGPAFLWVLYSAKKSM